jgi:hypothetical protein
MKLSTSYMKMLAEILHDYLKQVGDDPDRRKRIKFAQVLLAEIEAKLKPDRPSLFQPEHNTASPEVVAELSLCRTPRQT